MQDLPSPTIPIQTTTAHQFQQASRTLLMAVLICFYHRPWWPVETGICRPPQGAAAGAGLFSRGLGGL